MSAPRPTAARVLVAMRLAVVCLWIIAGGLILDDGHPHDLTAAVLLTIAAVLAILAFFVDQEPDL